jgi:hypothetical protein
VEDFVEQLARGNVEQVKVVLASVVAALAAYQVLLMAVGYGKLRLPFLASRPASSAHRAVGDTIVVITLVVAFMCLSYFGFEDGDSDEETRAALHATAGSALVAALVLKVVVVRWWHRMGRFLPVIGATVFTLFMITWLSSAGDYLMGS